MTAVERRSTGRGDRRRRSTSVGVRRRRAGPRRRRRARRSPRCTTTTTGSARRSTWPATASARASTGTSPTRCRPSSPSCARRSGRTCCRSPGTGPTRAGQPAPWPDDARRLARHVPRRRAAPADAAAAALRRRATGTPCTATSTATSCSRCRSSIGLDEPGVDYEGGEFVVVEQRPRAQSRATATTIGQRRGARVHDARPAGALGARLGGGADAPRREHRARRPPPHPRPRLPRRRVRIRAPHRRRRHARWTDEPAARLLACATASDAGVAAPSSAHGSSRVGEAGGEGRDRPAVGAQRRGRRARPTRAAWRPARRPAGRTEYGGDGGLGVAVAGRVEVEPVAAVGLVELGGQLVGVAGGEHDRQPVGERADLLGASRGGRAASRRAARATR